MQVNKSEQHCISHIQLACVLCGCLIEMECCNQCPVCKVVDGTGRERQ